MPVSGVQNLAALEIRCASIYANMGIYPFWSRIPMSSSRELNYI